MNGFSFVSIPFIQGDERRFLLQVPLKETRLKRLRAASQSEQIEKNTRIQRTHVNNQENDMIKRDEMRRLIAMSNVNNCRK